MPPAIPMDPPNVSPGPQLWKLQGLLLPVPAIGPALALLRERLKLEPQFQDGARYAALPIPAATLALAAGAERIVDAPALMVRVADVDAAVRELCASGADLLRTAESGPHERRAVLRAAGIPVVLSQKLVAADPA
ncbi:MAG: VOC family protein [Solimonas sp.]